MIKDREGLVDLILKVAMGHHEDISQSDENNACECADTIIRECPGIFSEPLDEEMTITELQELMDENEKFLLNEIQKMKKEKI